jgi:hypothetical protein
MEFIELGLYTIFARVLPERTLRVWTGRHPADRLDEERTWWGPQRLLAFRRMLIEQNHRLLLCHAPDRDIPFGNGLAPLTFEIAMRYARPPIVGLDFNDRIFMTRRGLRLLDRSLIYFKRELPIDRSRMLPRRASARHRAILERNLHKLRPISIGLGAGRLADMPAPLPPKRSDIFFAGTVSNKNRIDGVPLLRKLQAMGVTVDLAETRLDRRAYLQRSAEARLVWSPDGVGWDCFRHYEAGAVGSVPVMPRPWIEPYKPILEGEMGLYYDPEGEDLIRVVTDALRNPERLSRMSEAARRHVLATHMHEQIIAYAIGEIDAAMRNVARERPAA